MDNFDDCVHKFGDEITLPGGEKCKYIGISAGKRICWSETRGILIVRTEKEEKEFQESLKVPSFGQQIRRVFSKK